MIMPLANRARQASPRFVWGIRDFEHRFGREPEGMWLRRDGRRSRDARGAGRARHPLHHPGARTRQRACVRSAARRWRDVAGGRIDPTRAYRCACPSGRSIALFFYDGPISRAVAFERLLDNGEDFASRLLGASTTRATWPQLVHIATDGETYGHHHRHGDMALAYALAPHREPRTGAS